MVLAVAMAMTAAAMATEILVGVRRLWRSVQGWGADYKVPEVLVHWTGHRCDREVWEVWEGWGSHLALTRLLGGLQNLA